MTVGHSVNGEVMANDQQPVINESPNLRAMAELPYKEIGLRFADARKALDLTQAQLAELLGKDQSTVGHWERGRSKPDVEDIQAIETHMGIRFDWLTTGRPPRLIKNMDLRQAESVDLGPANLPVFTSARGSFDGSEIDYLNPIGMTHRPPQLSGLPKAAAILVAGESMEPRYYAGETLLVHPTDPPRRGDYVVVELADHRAIVKRLIRLAAEYVEVEQLNPAATMKLQRKQVVGLYKIIGSWAAGPSLFR